jgi:MFS transporter, PAT family, beta-lactamase induction signal transducer AmpG
MYACKLIFDGGGRGNASSADHDRRRMNTAGIRRRIVIVTLLGFSSGLPLALTGSTLQAWLAVSDIDIATIGLFSFLTIPYIFKFLWAPLLDRFCPPGLGRRRGWMAVSQASIIGMMFVLAGQDPSGHIMLIAWLALGLAFVSATQDIAVDAYRAEILRPNERGLGAGMSVAGYRIATVVSGAGALVLADRVGFNATYSAIAVVAFVGLAVSLVADEPTAPAETPRDLLAALIQPLQAFFQRRHAVALLLLVGLYKLGDAAAGGLTITFLIRALDFSLTEVGAIYKGLSIGTSLLGGIFGGALMFRWGLYRSLMVFAVLQALTNVGFVGLAVAGKSYVTMILVVALENVSGGMGTAALVALLMAICDRRYTATQFALLTGVASLGRVLSGPPSGYFVDAYGWANFFGATVMIALPGIFLLRRLRPTLDGLDAAVP